MVDGKATVKHNDSQPWSWPGTLHVYEELAACSRELAPCSTLTDPLPQLISVQAIIAVVWLIVLRCDR